MAKRRTCWLALGSGPIAGAALLAITAGPVSAVELKLGHFLPTRHHNHAVVMQPWADEVGKRSNGSLTVKVYPSSQLGGTPTGMYNQVLSGVTDISFIVPGYTPTVFPATGIVELPYLAKNAQHATRILNSLFDKYLAKEYKDVKVLTFWTVDSYIVQSAKPITTLEELKGKKVRSPSAVQSDVAKALGAVPVNMPITNVYTSLERGVIDGFIAGPSALFSFKLDEVVKSMTTGFSAGNLVLLMVMNKKAYEALSPEHKKIIGETTGPALGLRGAKAYDEQGDKALELARKRPGSQVVEFSQAEQAKIHKAAEPMIDEWIAAREKEGYKAREMYNAAKAIN
jgi:TRAP-type C4-dicarboxylate transport system substrate-binding protein